MSCKVLHTINIQQTDEHLVFPTLVNGAPSAHTRRFRGSIPVFKRLQGI